MKVTIVVDLVWRATPFALRERVWGHLIVQVVQTNVDEGGFVLRDYVNTPVTNMN